MITTSIRVEVDVPVAPEEINTNWFTSREYYCYRTHVQDTASSVVNFFALNLQKVYVPFAISITPDEVPRSLVELVVMLTIVQVTVALPYAPLLVRSIASVLPKPESGSCVVTLD